MPEDTNRWLPYLPLFLAVLILATPILFTGQALYWGTPGLQFIPWREVAFQTVRSGQLPLWNPWLGMGAPLLANYQVALLYPPTWLLFFLSFLGGIEWHAWGQMLLVTIHCVIAGMGMARLARRLGLEPLSQAISGLAYGLGAYLVARAGFLSINAAAAWLPWIADYSGRLASTRLRRGESGQLLVLKLAAVVVLQLLAGHAQTAWYTALLVLPWSGYWAWVDASDLNPSRPPVLKNVWNPLRHVLKTWLWVWGGYLLAAGLAAVQLLPTAEYLLESQRSGAVNYETAMTYSFWPWRLLTLLAPGLFGSPVSSDYWGYANYWEDALYIGLLPLLLAIAAVLYWLSVRIRGKSDKQSIPAGQLSQQPRWEAVPLLLVITLLSLLLALGKNTPVFPWLYRHVPTFDMFQAPARFTLWAAFSLPLLAGFGVQVWHRPRKRALYWTRLGTAGAAAVTIGAGLTWYWLGDVSPTFIRATALAGLMGVAAGILSLLAPPESYSASSTRWHWAVALFVAVDLIIAGWQLNPGVDARFFSQPNGKSDAISQMLAGRRLYISPDDEYQLKYERFLRFDSYKSGEDPFRMRQVLLPNLNMLDRVPVLSNFDPLVPARYAAWMDALNRAQGKALENMLDLSGVGAVEHIDPSAEYGVSFSQLPTGKGLRARLILCENQSDNGISMPPLDYIQSESFDVRREVLLEDGSGTVFRCLGSGLMGTVESAEELPDRLTYQIQASSPGWLLVADTWYPGWQVFVDGVERPLVRADTLFRAVVVGPGDREVVLQYKPLSFSVGLAVSLIVGLGLLFVVAYLWHARTQPESKVRDRLVFPGQVKPG